MARSPEGGKFNVKTLVARCGWNGIGWRMPVRCFSPWPKAPSILRFLSKTPWARETEQGLCLFMMQETRRGHRG